MAQTGPCRSGSLGESRCAYVNDLDSLYVATGCVCSKRSHRALDCAFTLAGCNHRC